MRDS
jgi:hypothetical protein